MIQRESAFSGLSTLQLRGIATALMLCDHLWANVLPNQNWWMTCLGRAAFPVFAFLLAEGFRHTGDRGRYLRRLLLWAVISEIPFNLMYEGSLVYPFHQNVLWTLALGLVCVWGMETVRQRGKRWLTLLAAAGVALGGWLLGTVLLLDYFGGGVLTVILFALMPGRTWPERLGQAAGLWWINWVLLGGLFYPVTLFGCYMEIPQQGFALLALPLIWLYRGRQGYHSGVLQTACYAFYPAHMLVLYLIASL